MGSTHLLAAGMLCCALFAARPASADQTPAAEAGDLTRASLEELLQMTVVTASV